MVTDAATGPTAEVITIGDEIVSGLRIDSNSAFVAARLTEIGLNVRFTQSAPDSLEEMEEAFRLALRRSDVVITTGGLGPTDDDITKKAVVKLFKRNLVFHEDILEDIRRRYAARGIDMPAINQNQALLPQGATLFYNKFGSAMGICLTQEGHTFIALPGVPAEMKQIMLDEVIPYLRQHHPGRAVTSIILRTTGIVESALAERITEDLRLEPGVRLAYLPGYSGVVLRVRAEAETLDEAETKAARLIRHLESRAGKYIYGRDDDTLEGIVGQLLKDNDKTLAVAESCTGGQLGMTITSVPGASAFFLGGVIAYDDDVKISQLGVEAGIIAEHGAVSEECALAMAQGCRKRFSSDYAVAITGIAGPEGGTVEKPVGTVYIALASGHAACARRFNTGVDRESVRARSVFAALEMLRRDILDIT
jgi:nicotinamide-nucleotide amidase